MNLNKKLHLIKTRLRIIKNDLRCYSLRNFFPMLKMWSKGFSYDKTLFYNFKEYNFKDYLSDYAWAKTHYINRPYDVILNNKIIFEKVVGKYLRVPKNYAYLNNGFIHPISIYDVLKLLFEKEALVVKPVLGGGGKSVHIIKVKEKEIYLDKNLVSESELIKYLLSLNDYLICEFIKQGEFPNSLYPDSTNTMRIMMMRNPLTNKGFIASCAQRIGSKKTKGKDNLALGGYCAGISIETGELSYLYPNLEKHPETNKQIKGLIIPNWEKIKNELLDVFDKLPFLKYIGWDIVLTDDGFYAIEGNDHPDPKVVQGFKPLLIDKKIKEFYQYYQVI